MKDSGIGRDVADEMRSPPCVTPCRFLGRAGCRRLEKISGICLLGLDCEDKIRRNPSGEERCDGGVDGKYAQAPAFGAAVVRKRGGSVIKRWTGAGDNDRQVGVQVLERGALRNEGEVSEEIPDPQTPHPHPGHRVLPKNTNLIIQLRR